MGKNTELPKVEFDNLCKMITNFHGLYLFICFTVILDIYLIAIFDFGLINLDVSILLNVYNIKHLLFFCIIFGITFNQISQLLYFILFKIFVRWLYKPDTDNSIKYLLLKKQAIENRDIFLMDYVRNESNNVIKVKLNYQVMYTLLFSMIVNSCINNSILRKTIEIFHSLNNNVIQFCYGLILFIIIGTVILTVYNSVAFDEEKIYFKK